MHKRISYGGMGCALCLIMLALSVYLPSGKAAALFVASFVSYAVCSFSDRKTGIIMYGAASLLSVLLLWGASPVIVSSYVICFGNYPVIKTALDAKPPKTRLVGKALLYVIYFAVFYFVAGVIVNITIPYAVYLLFATGIPIFAFYDYLLLYTGRYVNSILHK